MPILESKGMREIFREGANKGKKNVKKGETIWKFGQKCTKFENILKNGRWLRAIIARSKLLEKALSLQLFENTVNIKPW